MKVSIIIAVYNEEKYINKCLVSLIEQSFQDFEIIVVDDGSTDKTSYVLSEIRSRIKRDEIRNFQQKHQGPAVARNMGAKYAKGDILVFVDGDMYFDKKFLKDLIQPINLGKTKGTFSLEEYVANWDNVWARCWNYNWNLINKRRIDPRRSDQQMDFRAIRKFEFIRIGGFDDIGYTDTWTLSEKLRYRPMATKALYYHYNPSSLFEVFNQAIWVAKRPYKMELLGKLAAIIRANFIFSIFLGIKKAISFHEPWFLLFKPIYDFGIIMGVLLS